MELDEIVLPETKPETEWVRGRALQKVSPKRSHGRVQMEFSALLNEWSRGRGEVAPEWRFRIEVPGEARRPLVPDIAYVANERLRGFTADELEAPPFAPTVAIEILSQGDSRADVEDKIEVYLLGGSVLVLVIDPRERPILVCDAGGRKTLTGDAVFASHALPGFRVGLEAFFANALDRNYDA